MGDAGQVATWPAPCGDRSPRGQDVPTEDTMRFTFADEAPVVRRNPMLVWARRVFDLVVIGAVLAAAVETIVFLSDMTRS